MEELIPITLWIAGRGYRIKVKKRDEEGIRFAAKLADEKVNELRNSYAGKDDQDFLAMCLLMYATDQVSDENTLNHVQRQSVQGMIKQIDKITAEED